jgi:hypothetical protein
MVIRNAAIASGILNRPRVAMRENVALMVAPNNPNRKMDRSISAS